MAKDASVLLNNLTTLVTSKCMEVVNYKRDCESEEVIYKCSFSVNCPNTLEDQNTTASHNLKVALFIVGGLFMLIIITVIVITKHVGGGEPTGRERAEDVGQHCSFTVDQSLHQEPYAPHHALIADLHS